MQATVTDTKTNQTKTVVLSSNDLLDQTGVDLEIWECFLGLACLYVAFTAFSLLALKIGSRRV